MNKEGHVLNAMLLGLGLGIILSLDPEGLAALSAPTSEAALAQAQAIVVSVVELTVPVTLGALFPDVDTAFGTHRKTLHNLPVLALFVAFPFVFGNLQFVWIGIATHYLLDAVGSKRGIALYYPFSRQEYGLPTGVATSSKWANPLTVAISVGELIALGAVHYMVVPLDTGVTQAIQTAATLGL